MFTNGRRILLLSTLAFVVGCVHGERDPADDPGTLPPEDCASDQIWDTLLARCVPTVCGAARYPAVPDGVERAFHVDPGFTGTALGDPDYPFHRLDQALAAAADDSAILLAAGDHPVDYALDVYQSGVEVVGRCPELTRLVVQGPHRGLRVGQTSDVRFHGFSVVGTGEPAEGQPLLECFNATGVAFEDLVLEDSSADGLLSWQCADVRIEDVIVRRAVGWGIHAGLNSGLSIRASQVIDTRTGTEPGAGIHVEHGTDAAVEDCIVEDGEVPGIRISDVDTATVRGNVVHAPAGAGLELAYCEGALLQDNAIDDARGFGLRLQASAGDVLDNRITATTPDDEGLHGIGLSVEDGMEVQVSGNSAVGSAEIGLAFVRSSGSLSANVVEGTVPGSWGQGGRGMEIVDVSGLEVRDNVLQGNAEAGIVVMDATVTLEDNRILDTTTGTGAVDGYPAGHGIHVQTSTDVICRGNTIEGAQRAGISFLWVLRGEILHNSVLTTGVGGGGAWGFGDGIQVVGADGEVRVEGNTLQQHDRCGLLADRSHVWAVDNDIEGNEYALVVQNDGLLLADENQVQDNLVDETVSYDDSVFQVFDQAWVQLSDDQDPEEGG